jgi:hypothetical protein
MAKAVKAKTIMTPQTFLQGGVEVGKQTNPPTFVLCGCCEHYHAANWFGDCRDDDHRFTTDQLEQKYGREGEGWIEMNPAE